MTLHICINHPLYFELCLLHLNEEMFEIRKSKEIIGYTLVSHCHCVVVYGGVWRCVGALQQGGVWWCNHPCSCGGIGVASSNDKNVSVR